MNLPAVALGIITGGFVLKRFKLGVIGAARVSVTASVGSLCLFFIQIFIYCDKAEVAGLTVSYQGWVRFKPVFPSLCLHFLLIIYFSQNRTCLIQSNNLHWNKFRPHQSQKPLLTNLYSYLCVPGILKCLTTNRPWFHNATWPAPAQWNIGTQYALKTE